MVRGDNVNDSRRWPEQLDSIVEEFSSCFDSMERYELLFQYAKRNSLLYRSKSGMMEIKYMVANHAHTPGDLDEDGTSKARSMRLCRD